jgi:hypothetical protein
LAAITVTVMAGVLVTGCGSSSKSGTSSTTTNRSLSVGTPEGTVTLSLNDQLPPGWPSGFPVPSGATPAGSGSIENKTTSHLIAVFEAPGSGQDAFNFYKNSTTLKVTDPKSVGVGNAFVGRLHFSGPYKGSVTVANRDSRTLIVVYLNTGGSQATTTTAAQ